LRRAPKCRGDDRPDIHHCRAAPSWVTKPRMDLLSVRTFAPVSSGTWCVALKKNA
jgi:hypothetical protein